MSDKPLKGILKNKKVLEGFGEDDNNDFSFRAGSKQVTEKIDKKLQRNFMEKQKNKMGKHEFDRMIKKQEKKDKKKNKKDMENEDSESWDSSSDEPEDEFGDLVSNKLQTKFIQTLAKLKNKTADIYDEDKKFFSDSDFEQESDEEENQKDDKKFSYKDMVQQDIERKMRGSDNEDSSSDDENQVDKKFKNRGETPHEEQLRIQREFKEKSKQLFGGDGDDDNDEEDLFQVKKKTQGQLDDEEEAYSNLIGKLERRKKKEDQDMVSGMWGNKEKMGEDDLFLRNYILGKGWIDREDYEEAQQEGGNSQIDEEDEEREDEMEEFEHKYNFRYEEPGGAEIQTFGRNIEGTVRQKTSARAEKRKEKKEEKRKEKEQMEEKIKRLKNAKKQEILDRLTKIQNIGGLDEEELLEDENFEEFLDKEYNEEDYNKMMKKKFGKSYRKQEDDNEEELKAYEKKLIKEMDLPSDDEELNGEKQQLTKEEQKNKDKDVTNAKVNIPVATKKNLSKAEVDAIQNESDEDGEHNMICWYCDNCERGLQPGEQRFECQECPDYVLCKQCNGDGIHQDHKLKRFIVPQNCAPPDEDTLKNIISNFKICKKCDAKLNEYTDIYTLTSDANSHLCDECYDKEKYQQQQHYELHKASRVDIKQLIENGDLQGAAANIDDEVIDKLVNEYYALDFEDVIAGGIKTRFQYSNVKPEGYGLSDEQILYSDPSLLNGLVSMKKLAPYRDDEGLVKTKVLKNKAKINQIDNSVRLVKYQIKKENERIQELEEKIRKLKKGKKNEKKIEKLQKKLQKIKAQKKKPLTADYFKKLGRKDQESESSDEENNNTYGKKQKIKLTDLSQKKEKINVSASRLSTYGISKDN